MSDKKTSLPVVRLRPAPLPVVRIGTNGSAGRKSAKAPSEPMDLEWVQAILKMNQKSMRDIAALEARIQYLETRVSRGGA